MTAPHRWTPRTLAALTLIALAAGLTSAQVVVQPPAKGQKNDAKTETKHQPKHEPKADPPPVPKFRSLPGSNPPPPLPQPFQLARPNPNSIVVMPSINTSPVLPVNPFPVYPTPFSNPALYNPWLYPTTVNPFVGPFNNPFNNPFAVNPLFNNPFAVNPFFQPVNPLLNPFPVVSTPPIAVQQPGLMLYRGPNLQVNPWSGTVYHPISGTATLADGSTFYRVPGTGLPNANGTYANGTGLYYNPMGGTFFNPASGVISKPGTSAFLPYVW